jgi:hypothetical protein
MGLLGASHKWRCQPRVPTVRSSPVNKPKAALSRSHRLPYTASRSFTAPSRSTETSCETPRSAMVTP